MRYRSERDFLGSRKVPADAYYGIETQRALENFPISGIHVPQNFIKAYAIVKRSAAITNSRLGKLDAAKAKAIVKACDEIIAGKHTNQFPVDVFQAGAGTSTNMNLNEVIANRALEIMGRRHGDYKYMHPNDHVNMSQSTNDTFPSAMHIAVYASIKDDLIPKLWRLQRTLEKKAGEFAGVVKVGRTHLQDAVPMTLGQEFSGYASAVERSAGNLERAADALLVLPLGGTAIGTGIEASRRYSAMVISEVDRYTGMRFKAGKNLFDLQQNELEEIMVSSALRDLAVVLSKVCNDLRLLASGPNAGFGEILLPAVQPGSSIMPGKVNPSVLEMYNMVCFDVIGKDATVAYAAESGQLELNVFMPIIAFTLLTAIDRLSTATDVLVKRSISGIRANEKRMQEQAEHDITVVTALAPYIGYSKAASIAKKARKEGKSVRQVCVETKIMSKAELDKILNLRNLTKRK